MNRKVKFVISAYCVTGKLSALPSYLLKSVFSSFTPTTPHLLFLEQIENINQL